MFRFIKTLFRRRPSQATTRRPSRRPDPKARLRLENLEDRLVPAITDMTALALSQGGAPPSPQALLLNFDGWTNVPGSVNNDGKAHSVSPFSGTPQQVNDIIFRVSELFAPFDVTVEQIHGGGVYANGPTSDTESGPSTIFIGGDTANVGNNGKFAYGHTPGQFNDYPHAATATTAGDEYHPLHSDFYNLAFVDPVYNTVPNAQWGPQYSWTVNQDDATIASAIAHEAGHTFGLAHVASNPTPDLMSYDAGNQYFALQTFPITDLNNSGTSTVHDPRVDVNYQGTNITTQNSYTYLGAELGYRLADEFVHVVHNGSVDPYYQNTTFGTGGTLLTSPNFTLGGQVAGSLSEGDYDVYRMQSPGTGQASISLSRYGATSYLELLVYDQGGNLIQAVDGNLSGDVFTTLNLTRGQNYEFVVGTEGADYGTRYTFQVGAPSEGLHPVPPRLPLGAGILTHSFEYYTDFVTGAYQKYLGRGPDAAGLAGWVWGMQHGVTDERLEAFFIGSAEYIAGHGGAGAGWVQGMYRDLLGRTPAQAEVNQWVNGLNQGLSTTYVAYGFAASAERETERVQGDYETYLGRAASAAEVAGWVDGFEHGLSNEAVIAGFIGSAEYFNNQGGEYIPDWVARAYQDVLHRLPGANEVAAWVALLS